MDLRSERAARIDAAVTDHRQDLIELTTEFCRIAAENPPGAGLRESQAWLADTLDRYRIPFETHDTSQCGGDQRTIIGAIGSAGPVFYLHGHYDVVPAFEPHQFRPIVRDGSIHGRGAADMKGGLVAMLIGAVIHRDLGGAGRVRLVCVPDEESGGANGSERLDDLGLIDGASAVGAIVGEPSHPDIWYAARGALTVEVTLHGRPAHVGLHYEGANAFEHAHDVITALLALRDEIATRTTTYRIEPEAARSSIMLLGGISSGGTNYNIVPDRFSFTIDRRPNPDEDYDRARAELLSELDALAQRFELTYEILQDVHPADTPIDHPLIGDLHQAIAEVSDRHAPLSMCPGCLETRIYSRLGIPTVAYGPGPMAEMHQPTEHVPIVNLTEAASVVARVLGAQLGHET